MSLSPNISKMARMTGVPELRESELQKEQNAEKSNRRGQRRLSLCGNEESVFIPKISFSPSLRIDRDFYTLDTIGQGSFGKVYRVRR